jgi:hypothetical protein
MSLRFRPGANGRAIYPVPSRPRYPGSDRLAPVLVLLPSRSVRAWSPYEEIPDFVLSTVEGHSGRLVVGSLQGVTETESRAR